MTLRLSKRGGGVAAYVGNLATRMSTAGLASGTLVSTDDVDDRPLIQEVRDSSWHHAPCQGWSELGYSPQVWKKLPDLVAQSDVVHLHGLRTLLGWKTRALAGAMNKPLVISSHGQLDPWLTSQRRAKKKAIDTLWLKKSLRAAKAFLAMSQKEADDMRKACPAAAIATVPIGIDAHEFMTTPRRDVLEKNHPELRGKRLLNYCAVMMPRKGIDELVNAWGRLHRQFPDWHLVIAGSEYAGNRADIEERLRASGANQSTTLLGFISDQTKRELFASSELMVLPTHSEAFGISIAESLASSCAVLTTTAAPWPDLEKYECGWRTDVGLEPTIEGLKQALNLSADELAVMGKRGVELVNEQYTWESSVRRIAAFYRWVMSEEDRPEFVV